MAGAVLEARDISKQFRAPDGSTIQALAPASFSVEPLEFVSVVGPSGCGKSTLFNIVAGLETQTTGTIRFEGKEVTSLRGRIAYQLQKDLLLPWRNILDNVALGLEIRGTPRDERRERAMALLRQYGLGAFAERFPSELSGGMRQRAALIRTLLFDRSIILLDEPFGALDAQTRVLMQEWLRDLSRDTQKTILLITHDIDEAIFLSSRVLVMSARPGSIRADVAIDLPRSNASDVLFEPRFAEYKRELFAMIREESLKAFEASQLVPPPSMKAAAP